MLSKDGRPLFARTTTRSVDDRCAVVKLGVRRVQKLLLRATICSCAPTVADPSSAARTAESACLSTTAENPLGKGTAFPRRSQRRCGSPGARKRTRLCQGLLARHPWNVKGFRYRAIEDLARPVSQPRGSMSVAQQSRIFEAIFYAQNTQHCPRTVAVQPGGDGVPLPAAEVC